MINRRCIRCLKKATSHKFTVSFYVQIHAFFRPVVHQLVFNATFSVYCHFWHLNYGETILVLTAQCFVVIVR